jgi:hypothetical protein
MLLGKADGERARSLAGRGNAGQARARTGAIFATSRKARAHGPSSDASRTAGPTAANGGWLRSITTIVIFDVAAPLAAYNLLRSAGLTAVTALLLSGVFPALGVTLGAIWHRRLDLVGALVLAGILVGTVLGLVSHSAKLLLVVEATSSILD